MNSIPQPASPSFPNIALFSGGNPTNFDVSDPTNINALFGAITQGSYTTVILWAAHVSPTGDIKVNDDPVIVGGLFQEDTVATWAQIVRGLKSLGSVTRVELSLGGDDDKHGDHDSFKHLVNLVNSQGTGPDSILYKNFAILQQQLNLDAINYDNESRYSTDDSKALQKLAVMCAGLGMRVTMSPYTHQDFWVEMVKGINAQSPGTADAIYLQCYDGGSGNQPPQWNKAFASTGLTVCPGFWCTHPDKGVCSTATAARDISGILAPWQKASPLAGGWMYLGTAMLKCANGGTPADYATAIRKGLGAL